MRITSTKWIAENWSKMNKVYFEGKLHTPKFELSNRKGAFGDFFHWRAFRGLSAKEMSAHKGIPNGRLRMSVFFDRPEADQLNTLLHEMIHQWQFENGMKVGHGTSFRAMGTKFRTYGWGIERCDGHGSERAVAHMLRNA